MHTQEINNTKAHTKRSDKHEKTKEWPFLQLLKESNPAPPTCDHHYRYPTSDHFYNFWKRAT